MIFLIPFRQDLKAYQKSTFTQSLVLKNENNEGIITINPDLDYGLGNNDYFAVSVHGYLPDGKSVDPNSITLHMRP